MDNDQWWLILECYWYVTTLRLEVFAVLVTKLKTSGDGLAIGGIAYA